MTGATGHGEAIFTMQQALEIASASNKEWYSQIHHSIEKYESPSLTLNVKGHRCSYGDLSFVGNATPTPTVSQEATPIASAPSAASVPSSASSAKEASPPLR
jgi:hypothetical protein